IKLFGYRGKNGLTAYFEKQSHKRGLVVYEAGKPPQWVGIQYYGLSGWAGPGYVKNWLVYDEGRMLAMDPNVNYTFDEGVVLPENGFHIFEIPSDFALNFDDYVDSPVLRGQRFTSDGSCYLVKMSGH